jgi:aminoglycoside phosphotransferase (APT) family kinase protein
MALVLGEIVGRGAVADIHAAGDSVVKLFHAGRPSTAAFIEAATLAIVGTHAIPAPRVHGVGRYGKRWGVAMDRVEGSTLGAMVQADPALVPACLDEMVQLQLRLHAVAEPRLRSLRAKLGSNLERAEALPAGLRQRLQRQLAALPDGDRLCHGDFHPFNLMGEPGSCVIVDWLDATSGPPAADACRSYLLLRQGAPALAEGYLNRYVAASDVDRAAILGWLPCLAGARLAEGIGGETERLLELAGG